MSDPIPPVASNDSTIPNPNLFIDQPCPGCRLPVSQMSVAGGLCLCCGYSFVEGRIPESDPTSNPVTTSDSEQNPTPNPPQPSAYQPVRQNGFPFLLLLVLIGVMLLVGLGWRMVRDRNRSEQPPRDQANATTEPEKPAGTEHPSSNTDKDTRNQVPNPVQPPVIPPKQKQDLVEKPKELPELLPEPKEIPQFDRRVAQRFAYEVLEAVDIISKNYHREPRRSDLIHWAIEGLYRAANEKPPELDPGELLRRLKDKPPDEFNQLESVRADLGIRESLENNRDIDIAIQTVCEHLDQASARLSPEALLRMRSQQYHSGLGEIGLEVRRNRENRTLEVVTPWLGSSAFLAGVQSEDVITQFQLLYDPDGNLLKIPQVVLAEQATQNDLDRLLWGRVGQKVLLTVVRDKTKTLEFEVPYARLKREAIFGYQRWPDLSWDHVIDQDLGIHYLRIHDFHRSDLRTELPRVLGRIEGQRMRGLILDLRFGNSGLIDSAADVADLFVTDGFLCEFRSREQPPQRRQGQVRGSRAYFPMVCLVNSSSGTCVEMVAGSLQDNKRACIVGERTGGRASLQSYFPLQRGSLRLTISHAYRVNGVPLDRSYATADQPDGWGVKPDPGYEVELTAKEREQLRERLDGLRNLPRRDVPPKPAPEFRDRQLEKALEYFRKR